MNESFIEYIAHIRKGENFVIVQTCREHSRNVAEIAASLLSAVNLKRTGYLAGLVHDMGKYSKEFTEYIKAVSAEEEYSGKRIIHSFAGVSYILNKYHKSNLIEKLTSEIIAIAVGAHHGLFDIFKEENDFNGFLHRIEKQPDYDSEAAAAFLRDCAFESEIEQLFKESVVEVRSFVRRIGVEVKNDENARRTRSFFLGLLSRLVLSAVVEGDRRDTAAFMYGRGWGIKESVSWKREIQRMENLLASFPQSQKRIF